MIRKLLKSQGGFTLVEMITVVIVIVTLSTLVIVSTQVSNRRQQMHDAAAGYVSAAKHAESLASGSQAIVDPDQANQPTSRKAYGVCITSSQITNSRCADPAPAGKPADMYQVYARDLNETALDTEASLQNRPNQPEIINSYKLPKDYTFLASNVWLDYVPPSPTLFARGLEADNRVIVNYKTAQSTGECIGNSDCEFIEIRPRAGAVYVQ